ncbi:MAG: hypothetical protein WCB01_12215, partial [Candidatus Cybelea sp.]
QGPYGPPPPPPAPVGQPQGQPTAAPTTDPAMLARAKSWFAQLQAGKIDRSQLATRANGALTDSTISNAQGILAGLGTPVSFVQQQAGAQGNISYAIYSLTFKNGRRLNFFFAVDSQGKVEGLQIGQPH